MSNHPAAVADPLFVEYTMLCDESEAFFVVGHVPVSKFRGALLAGRFSNAPDVSPDLFPGGSHDVLALKIIRGFLVEEVGLDADGEWCDGSMDMSVGFQPKMPDELPEGATVQPVTYAVSDY